MEKNGKGEKNEEENLGFGELLTLALNKYTSMCLNSRSASANIVRRKYIIFFNQWPLEHTNVQSLYPKYFAVGSQKPEVIQDTS